MEEQNKSKIFPLTQNEKNLIFKMRYKYPFSEIRIIVHNGIPQYIEEVKYKEKLDYVVETNERENDKESSKVIDKN